MRLTSFVSVFAGVLLAACSSDARPPEIRNVNIRGLQIGQATTITLDGVDLQPAPKVFLNDRSLDVVVDPQSNAARAVLTATVPNETTPGVAVLRLATADGVSNGVLVGLDRLPQQVIAESAPALPIALHGSVPGSGTSKTSFAGKANEEILIEVEARRLGSKLRPVIHLFNEQRKQIAWAAPSRTLQGDARLTAKLPADGKYSVEVHDAQYAPPGVSFFRLKIGQWQFADLAFPPAVTQGQEVALELLGNSGATKLPFKAPMGSQIQPVALASAPQASGVPPSVLISAWPEVLETANGAEPMPLAALPVAVSGRLDQPGQLDRFQLPVTAGTKLVFEVFGERLGSQIDAVLELRNKQGGVLASNDDAPNTIDPRLEFTVPAGLDAVEVVVRDTLDLGTSQAIYRLAISPADVVAQPIEAIAKADALNVAAGESQVVEVFVTRRGYDGPLQIALAQLPAGVTATGTEIPAGASGTLLTLTNASDAAAQLLTSVSVKSPDGAIIAPVRTALIPDDPSPAWLREQLAVASVAKPATAFSVTWADAAPLAQLTQGTKTALPVTFVRPSGMLGPLRLTLVGSHDSPRVNNQPNLAVTLRGERVVEVPIDPPVKAAWDNVAALDKQLVEATKQAAAAQADAKPAAEAKVQDLTAKKTAAEAAAKEAEAKANAKSELAVIVPAQLPDSSSDIVVRAQLLNPERNTVLRTAYSTVRRLPKVNPLALKLATPPAFEAMFDPKTGAIIKVAGQLERLGGPTGDVNFSVAGLPAGVSATTANVKPDQKDFALEIRFPANFTQTDVSGLKLNAVGPPDPMSGNLQVKNELGLTVKLTYPPK